MQGWSAVVDAPRVQVCPFKDRKLPRSHLCVGEGTDKSCKDCCTRPGLEELWSGITFDPLEEALLWEPACPVTAEAGLCEKREDGTCADLPHSSQIVSRGKVCRLGRSCCHDPSGRDGISCRVCGGSQTRLSGSDLRG